MAKGKSHTYEETHVNPMYQNDQQSVEVEVTVTENTYFDEAHLVERYDVSDLTKQFRNEDYLLQKLRAEFKLLNNSTGDPKLYNSEYEIVDTRRNKEENKLYLKGSTLDVLHNNNVSVLLEIPQNSLAERFWTLIDDHSIENIILLVKENEKVSEFYPTLDGIFKMNNFEISLDSAERTHKIIMMLTFNLQNKTKETIRNVKIYKTNVSDVPTVQAMCYILDKASEMREAPAMIMNSEMADLSVCGVLTVCLNVMFAIKNQSPFSVLENAMSLYKQDRRFFKNVDDYELCYKVIGNYLEAVNTYDCID
ncbi:receptor-type tyrosine-protein phosphatase alpha-like [Mytilus edulis]|uniref:receptor-type tyrosine-protein phosphatase alpha-like n=1 Tax=Mytilus edulis TaxID=6550 RepID=UPI0039EDF0F8